MTAWGICFRPSAASQDGKVSLHRLGQFIRARTPEAAPNLDFGRNAKRGG